MPQAAEMIKGIEVAVGVEVTASGSKALKSRISALRSRYPFIVVRAGSDETIRAASEDPNVDLLMHPCDVRRPLGIATARAAKLNQVSIGFDLSGLVHLRGSLAFSLAASGSPQSAAGEKVRATPGYHREREFSP